MAWNVAFVAQFGDTEPYPVIAVGAVWRQLIRDLAASLETDDSYVTCVDDVPAAVEAIGAVLRAR